MQLFLRTLLLLTLILSGSPGAPAEDLAKAFSSPPDMAKPWQYWYWMNGNVTREGILADLDAMQQAGIGGVFNCDIGLLPAGPVRFRGAEWWALKKLAVSEGEQRGIKVAFHSPGWSASGGPWITPEFSMQELAWSEVEVEGPCKFATSLPQPAGRLGYYRDAAVLGFPTPIGDEVSLKTLHPALRDAAERPISGSDKLTDGNPETIQQLPSVFEIVLDRPETFRSIYIRSRTKWVRAELSAWDEAAKKFVPAASIIRQAYQDPQNPAVAGTGFPACHARRFRLDFGKQRAFGGQVDRIEIAELEMSGGERLRNWATKAGFGNEPLRPEVLLAGGTSPSAIDPARVIDLTNRLGADGRLTWSVPPGRWTILRLGHRPTGIKVGPSPAGGEGLECDKLSCAAADFHYDKMMKPIFEALGPELARKAILYYHVDSFEAGWQNWTKELPKEFQKRRGYAMTHYLPALTGRVVGDTATTERFLWDFRRTISDLFADNQYGRLAKRAHRDGLRFSSECYNGSFEDLQCYARTDFPMTEFWVNPKGAQGPKSPLNAVNAAHTNGKRLVGAEAFTSGGTEERWISHPYSLKAQGDWFFCCGINSMVLHVNVHQPFTAEHLKPGLTLLHYGTQFNRGNTWWPTGAKPWLTYLTRCQSLLQQGEPVADILFFGGEEPRGGGRPLPEALRLPESCDYDICTAETLRRLKAHAGRIVLTRGKSYRYLVLPEEEPMTLATLRKVAVLARTGATVIGQPPQASPSLADYPAGTATTKQLARELWGETPGAHGWRAVGKGRVIWGEELKRIMARDNVALDFSYDEKAGLRLHYTHRTAQDDEIYFIANATPQAGQVNCNFRITGKVPEFWWPDSGRMEPCTVYQQTGSETHLPLRIEPCGSVFVVFRTPAARPLPHAINLEPLANPASSGARWRLFRQGERFAIEAWQKGQISVIDGNGRKSLVTIDSPPATQELTGPWELRFPAGWGAPEKIAMPKLLSWPEHKDPGIKYFSGTAVYRTTFNYTPNKVEAAPTELDLGDVEVIAQVRLNGKELGTFWKPPFRVDLTGQLRSGSNALEVRVTNLWPNRMIGDEQLPDDITPNKSWQQYSLAMPQWLIKGQPRPESRRLTYSFMRYWKKDDALLPSGLLGPVTLRTAQVVPVF